MCMCDQKIWYVRWCNFPPKVIIYLKTKLSANSENDPFMFPVSITAVSCVTQHTWKDNWVNSPADLI